MNFEFVCQIAIPIFSGTGVYFVARKDEAKKWGYVFGLASQPFWAYTLIYHKQWGLFLLSLFFTFQWCKGIYNYWIQPEKRKKLLEELFPPGSIKHASEMINPFLWTYCNGEEGTPDLRPEQYYVYKWREYKEKKDETAIHEALEENRS